MRTAWALRGTDALVPRGLYRFKTFEEADGVPGWGLYQGMKGEGLNQEDRKTIGEDIKLVQFRWPLGMPLVRKLEVRLWEVRSHLDGGRINRVLFTVRNDEMALLHGFIKKSRKIPADDLRIARKRKKKWLGE